MFAGDVGHVVFLEFFVGTGVVEISQLGWDFAVLRFFDSFLHQLGVSPFFIGFNGWDWVTRRWGRQLVGYFRKFRCGINLYVRVRSFNYHGLVFIVSYIIYYLLLPISQGAGDTYCLRLLFFFILSFR